MHGERKTLKILVATNRPIKAYGGIRLSEKVLGQLVEQLKGNLIPLVNNHDPMQRWEAQCLSADVIELPGGTKAVEAEFEVDVTDWGAIEADWASINAPGGISFTCGETIAELDAIDPKRSGTFLSIAADAAYFSDDILEKAASKLTSLGPVRIQRLYQFAAVPACRIIVDFTNIALSIGIAVIANALWASILLLLKHRKNANKEISKIPEPTQIDFRIFRDTDGSIAKRLQICSSDPDVLKQALDRLLEAVERPEERLKWDEENHNWGSL
jgi:hypothetical protein